MRAWDEGDERDPAARRARDREREQERTARELREQGIELDPSEARSRSHRGGDPGHDNHGHDHAGHDHPHDDHGHDHAGHDDPGHEHPHRHPAAEPGERPAIGIVGAGPVGTALGVAFTAAGWPVVAVSSRDPERREAFRRRVPGARAFAEPNALVDDVEIVLLAVPDDAIAAVAGSLRLYAGQAVVHTSGLLGPEVLGAAMAAGTQAGTFHPLVAFADVDRAVAALRAATVAIEGDEGLAAHLAELAEAIGAVPVRLAPGSKAAYHAAAVLAAGGVTALLDAIAELGDVVGLDQAGALAIYLPLVEQTLANARALGVDAALTGPTVRGDAGTVAAHLAAIDRQAPDVGPVYAALVTRTLAIATRRGTLSTDALERLRDALARRA